MDAMFYWGRLALLVLAALSPIEAAGQLSTRNTFTINGCVAETETGNCSQTNVNVQLDPLGITFDVGSSTMFHFDNLPPGNYLLAVLGRCNPFGCWARVKVTITDADVFVRIPILPFCTGDCNSDLSVSVDELVEGVAIITRFGGVFPSCRAFDPNRDGVVTVNELIQGTRSALLGCPDFTVVVPPSSPAR